MVEDLPINFWKQFEMSNHQTRREIVEKLPIIKLAFTKMDKSLKEYSMASLLQSYFEDLLLYRKNKK